MVRRLFLLFAWMLCAFTCAVEIAAQDPQAASATPIKSAASTAFVRRHRPDGWSVMGVAATNTGTEEGEAFLTVFVAEDPGRQYARRMWVPPESRRFTFLPIYVPEVASKKTEQLTLKSAMLETVGGREVLQRRHGELLTYDSPISIDHDPVKTAAYFRRSTFDENKVMVTYDKDVAETLSQARTAAGLTTNVTEIETEFLPPWVDVLRTYDSLVLTADRIQYDSGGQEALRGWLRSGGRLWITLDRVSPSTVALLLGNAVDLQVVDRVELDQYKLVTLDTPDRVPVEELCEYEEPVEMVRVATSASDIPFRVNGWPAAIRVPYGDGVVILTTLGARGWRTEFNSQPTKALKTLALSLFEIREGRASPRVFQPALEQQIGYRIPARSLAVTILSGYCLALFGVGIVLARSGRLDRLAWVVPIVTGATALIFIGLGMSSSQSVPPTLAYMQLAQYLPQSNEVRVDGLAAVYDQQSRDVDWAAQDRGWLAPDRADDSTVRRLVWTDADGTATQNASVKAGSISLASVSGAKALPQHVGVFGRFGPRGLEGRFERGELQNISDPVLVSASAPSLALTLESDGRFSASPDQTLAADQYTSDSLLNDAQRRRQDVLRKLLDATDTVLFPERPSLLFWSDPVAMRQAWPDGFAANGSSLGVVPLELRRTPAGESFRVPPTFLSISTLAGRQGVSTAFNPNNGQWMRGLTRPTEIVLRFQLPDQVLPAQLSQGTLTLRGNLPSRSLQVLDFGGGEPTVIRELRNFNGVEAIELTADQLRLDADGGVRIGIGVGETDGQRAKREQEERDFAAGMPSASGAQTLDNSTWQIEYVRLTVGGTVLAPGAATPRSATEK
ncbi:MAG: hypothetical protein U0939_13955 [Pirellulales bacterium]